MRIPALVRVLLWSILAGLLPLAASAQTSLGQIIVAKVQGQVTKIGADGASVALKDGDPLVESDTVVTAKQSGVVLVFANGSSVKVGSDSRLAVEEFKMDPLTEDVRPGTLKAEPNKSKTTLNLSYGEMVGDVKKLNSSSTYSIKTPVGAAGIRGTVYRIVFTPSANGRASFQVQTAEGIVVVQGVTEREVPVAAGKEVVVEIDSTNPAGANVITRDLSPENQAAIKDAAQAITEVLNDASVPGTSQQKSNSNDAALPIPTAPPPHTTPGAGQQ